MNIGLKISLWGLGLETVGLILDIAHHLNIGIETPEGLINPYHITIFLGFVVTFAGVLLAVRKA